MEYCCYTMNVHVFTDLKEEQFNKFLKNVELQLIKKMVIEKPIQFENRYYFRFEKVEWDNIRIDRELTHFIKHKYAAVQAWYEQTPQEYTYYEIGGIECDRVKAFEILKNKNPFDIKLCFEDKGVKPDITKNMYFKTEEKE